MSIPTPHISAEKGDFAKTVLMPGDPLRAKHIAENFMDYAVKVTDIRGVFGYTGKYKGVPVSVMASGMGIPSIGIYSYELFSFYDVQNIIRIGSAGALSDKLDLYDVVAAIGACTDSNYASQFGLNGVFAPTADYRLLKTFDECCKDLGISIHIGNILTSDSFYNADETSNAKWQKMGVLAVEMEAAGLYMNAHRLGKSALTVCTISDCPFKKTETTAEERQTKFENMITAALETARRL